jgi:hypothetical protein
MGKSMRCPFCEEWHPILSYTRLQLPPNGHAGKCEQIFKHGGEDGCKALFAPRRDQ